MKKNFVITVISFLLCTAWGLAKKKNVVHYFNLASDSVTLVKKGGKWTCPPPGYGSYKKPVVDMKNGYIKTHYMGGDGNDEREAALFLSKKREPFLGIAKFYDGIGGDYSISFFTFHGKKPVDVTGQVLPEITVEHFMKKGYDKIMLMKFREKAAVLEKEKGIRLVQFAYTLPRYGTAVKVNVHFKESMLYSGDEFKKIRRYIKYIKKNMKGKPLILKWDAAASKLVMK